MKLIKKIIGTFTFLLVLINCSSNNDSNCGRLGCLPNQALNTSTADNQSTIQYANGGLKRIIIYKAGTTYRAYDMQDPDKCIYDAESTLTLSNNSEYLESNTGEKFLLLNGQPTEGASCRGLITYNVSKVGNILTITN